jgi:hypothetical protein
MFGRARRSGVSETERASKEKTVVERVRTGAFG